MPLYEYRCERCGAVSEFLMGVVRDEVRPVCPECGSRKLTKLLSAPAVSVKGKSEGVSCCGLDNLCEDPKRCCGA